MIKDWTHTRKQQARAATLLHPIERDQQYWSMAGLCEDEGCELTQALDAGIRPHQFHGVDHDYEVYHRNVRAFPEIQWHHGDFYWTMARHVAFNPGIVNADLVQTADTGAGYVAKIMSLLTRFNCTLITNFILEHRGYRLKDGDYVLGQLAKHQAFRVAMRRGWTYDGRYYQYGGTGDRSKTVMGTFIFRR